MLQISENGIAASSVGTCWPAIAPACWIVPLTLREPLLCFPAPFQQYIMMLRLVSTALPPSSPLSCSGLAPAFPMRNGGLHPGEHDLRFEKTRSGSGIHSSVYFYSLSFQPERRGSNLHEPPVNRFQKPASCRDFPGFGGNFASFPHSSEPEQSHQNTCAC